MYNIKMKINVYLVSLFYSLDTHMYNKPDCNVTPGGSEQKLINILIWLRAGMAFLHEMKKIYSSILISAPMSSQYSFDWASSWRQTCQEPMGFNVRAMQSSFPNQITLISQTCLLCLQPQFEKPASIKQGSIQIVWDLFRQIKQLMFWLLQERICVHIVTV